MEKVLVVDANAHEKGKRFSTLDVIGVGPRLVTALFRSYNVSAKLYSYENVMCNPKIMEDYDVLAISFMISDIHAAKKLINLWNKVNKGIVILGGGGTLSQAALKSLHFAMAFKGEVEVTLQSIFSKCTNLREVYEVFSQEKSVVRGLVIRTRDGKILDGGLGIWAPKERLSVIPAVEDLKTYPFYWASRIYVEVVRGCSNFKRAKQTSNGKVCISCSLCYNGSLKLRMRCPVGIPPGCGYCSVPTVHGPARSRNLYTILEEIERLTKIGASRIVLSAPDFLDFGREELVNGPLTDPCSPPPNIDAIEELLSKLMKIRAVAAGKTVIMVENVKPCLVNDDVTEILGRYLKDTPIYIGLESCSDNLLEKIGRASTCSSAINAIKKLKSHGLRPYIYLMHGLPMEKEDDIRKTIECIDVLERIGVERIVLYRFRPIPCSSFENFAKPIATISDAVRRELCSTVIEFNKRQKKRVQGMVIKAIVAQKHPTRKGYLVAYPQKHGPVILIKGSESLIGHRVAVKIQKAISDRLVLGSVVYIHERYV
jgi:radical SAM superfamily enzyme YgiQ (UPF0313 family)